MPAKRPRASFEPISPHFDIREVVQNTKRFKYVVRISYDDLQKHGVDEFEKLVLLHVIIGGKPLVVDGFEGQLDPWTFTPKWLSDNHGDKVENARNLCTQQNLPLTIGHYLKNLRKLTDQYFDKPDNYKDKARQRMYLKDIDCPPVWQEKLKEHIPQSVFYWNESTGEVGGPGAVDEPMPNGSGRRKGKGIAIAGDLMSSLPVEMRAENLMCYIGHEGTYTPAHREMCASVGQNIMVNMSDTFAEDGQPEKPGSSIWFMTETKDRHAVAEYWLSVLGHDIEVEAHFAQMVAWQRAPFDVYVVEQRAGDFILIPPLAPHQVWNRGTRTMKVAWNRTTVETLEFAMKEALPNARMVCRDEQYKNKAIIYYTLLKYSGLLKSARLQASRSEPAALALGASKKVRQVQKDFRRLFELYKSILISESFMPATREQCEFLAFDSNVTCAYCRGNIFNRFLSCKTCMDVLETGTDEPYDICLDCFAMGRSCACQSKYKWVEQFKWKDLLARYEEWRKQIIDIDGRPTGNTPLALEDELKLYPKKTIAQVCQEQLKARPWVDVKQPKPVAESESEEEIEVNDDGTVKKTVKKRSKAYDENYRSCHVCCNRHAKWMMAICTMCERGWCYGSLWRGHDLMPQHVMEDPNWECPHCRRVCSTGACRKDKRQKPYEPKGTLLGHDTKKVADVRSVEALVDFSMSNLNWIRESATAAPQENKRLRRKTYEAEIAKRNDPVLDENYAEATEEGESELHDDRAQIEYSPTDDMIDPMLGGSHRELLPGSHLEYSGLDADGNALAAASSFHETSQYPDPTFHGTEGFVAPSAVMYQTSDVAGDESQEVQAIFSSSSKRSAPGNEEQIKLVEFKKRKVNEEDRSLPKNKASKQYQLIQDNKRLEEAKKAGRFIQVYGSIRGRKKLVTLNLPRAKLAGFAQQAESRARAQLVQSSTEAVVLQSDIAPPGSGPAATVGNTQPKKTGKQFRVRLEDDEDFQSRERADRPRKAAKARFEQITVDSDSDDTDGVTVPPINQRSRGGRSSWLTRRHVGEEDLPDELPSNFRDGDVNPRRARNRQLDRERRGTIPARAKALKTTQDRSFRASTGGTEGNVDRFSLTGNGEPATSSIRKQGKLPENGTSGATQRAVELAKAAMLEEDNRRAKLEAAGIAADFVSSSSSEESFAEKGGITRGPPKSISTDRRPTKETHDVGASPAVKKSIFSRPGMAGKKLKIVGRSKPGAAKNHEPTPGKTKSKAPAITAKSADLMEILSEESSSSGNDNEIPATLPNRRVPPGRTSLPRGNNAVR